MPTTRAAILRAPGEGLSVEEVELDDPRAGEVLLRMGASGVCHSDLHVVEGEWGAAMPLVLGHEGAGVVEAVGEGVRDVAGRRSRRPLLVLPLPPLPLLHRRPRVGLHRLALELRRPRRRQHAHAQRHGEQLHPYLGIGTFAAHSVVPESACVPIPREVPFEVACLIGCGVTTGVGAVVNTARVQAGAAVAVIGCGGVGLSVLMGARLAGANPIIAIDVEQEKLDLALAVGATHTVRGDGDVPADVRAIVPEGVDYAFEAIGLVPTVELMPSLLARGGTAVLVGMTPEGERASFDVFERRGVPNWSILGSNYGRAVAAIDFPRSPAVPGRAAADRPADQRPHRARRDRRRLRGHATPRARAVRRHLLTRPCRRSCPSRSPARTCGWSPSTARTSTTSRTAASRTSTAGCPPARTARAASRRG